MKMVLQDMDLKNPALAIVPRDNLTLSSRQLQELEFGLGLGKQG